MRVLDLGCGNGLTSIFLAKEFGVQVFAVYLWSWLFLAQLNVCLLANMAIIPMGDFMLNRYHGRKPSNAINSSETNAETENKRLEKSLKINIALFIIDSGYIQELIRDAPLTPFETVGSSERPDVIAAKLLEGRIALFVDGSPFVLTVPYLIVENFQANEDYYTNYILVP